MKINAIKRICLDEGECVIYNDEKTGEQWIGTTSACYPVDSGRITVTDIAGLFDIKMGKADAMTICEEDWQTCGIRPQRWMGDMQEYRCVEGVRIYCRGELCDIIAYKGTAYMVRVGRRNAARISEPYAGMFISWDRQGEPVFLIYSGFELAGIIRPEPAEATIQVLNEMAQIAKLDVGYIEETPTSEQTTMLEDEQ